MEVYLSGDGTGQWWQFLGLKPAGVRAVAERQPTGRLEVGEPARNRRTRIAPIHRLFGQQKLNFLKGKWIVYLEERRWQIVAVDWPKSEPRLDSPTKAEPGRLQGGG